MNHDSLDPAIVRYTEALHGEQLSTPIIVDYILAVAKARISPDHMRAMDLLIEVPISQELEGNLVNQTQVDTDAAVGEPEKLLAWILNEVVANLDVADDTPYLSKGRHFKKNATVLLRFAEIFFRDNYGYDGNFTEYWEKVDKPLPQTLDDDDTAPLRSTLFV